VITSTFPGGTPAFSSTSALRFTNAHCQEAIFTAPRTSVLTGVRPDTTKVWDLYDPSEIDLTDYNRNVVMPTGTLTFTKPFGTELNQCGDITGVPTAAQARCLIHDYVATVSYVDEQVGRVLEELETLGLASNTVVVIWGDRGWHLADHGAFWAKDSNFEQATRSLLLIRAPCMEMQGSGGLDCIDPVELISESLCTWVNPGLS
jgi:arylsulfatase A-like enzyme